MRGKRRYLVPIDTADGSSPAEAPHGEYTLTASHTYVYLLPTEDTPFTSFHLTGYDAGYYGYAWAQAIAADLATVFEKSPHGYLDPKAGARLREEIYAPGDSRDVNLSIETFLGRHQSITPFLKTLGIGTP